VKFGPDGEQAHRARCVLAVMADSTGTDDLPPLTVPVLAPAGAAPPDPTGTDGLAPLTVPVVLGGVAR
jgi:hypothetical protein